MQKIGNQNYPLTVGLILTGLFLFIALFGASLTSGDPMYVFAEPVVVDGQSIFPSRSPVPPLASPRFPLGTDNAGRDLLTRLLFAIRPTLVLCFVIATLRILIGLVLGLLAGWFGGLTERVIDIFTGASLAIPILIFALAAISFLGERTLWTFVLALVATGWASTAVFVKNSTLVTKKSPFIEGARAVGVRPFGILRRHIMPQLWPILPAQIAFELSASLLVVAELGFLGMFIGEAFVRLVEDPNSAGSIPVGLTASFPELAQMLSDFWSKMIASPWEIAIVGFIIFLQIFAFNMLGEGLRRQMDVTRPRYAWWRRRQPELVTPEQSVKPV
ncbi:MAG: glutathione ABC transporter permease GsiD [Ardenticatenaceae bacterium]|nr:MAG: glutathione ABC transporter permease GsiD [Ardenticatenaceae bacterium]